MTGEHRAGSLGLDGAVVIVTGATRGIGRATAERFAAEGARLVLNGRREDDALRAAEACCREHGAETCLVPGDVGDPGTALRLRDAALERFGRIDVLVNNAGACVEAPLSVLSAEDARRTVDTNVYGLIWPTQQVIPPMLRQRAGAIVNLSSLAASRPGPGNAVYAGSKGFVESFTRAMAAEVGRKGVRINAVAPGIIETEMSRPVRAVAGDRLLDRIAARRFGTAAEVAAVIAFLASPHAAYVSGAIIAADGAYT